MEQDQKKIKIFFNGILNKKNMKKNERERNERQTTKQLTSKKKNINFKLSYINI